MIAILGGQRSELEMPVASRASRFPPSLHQSLAFATRNPKGWCKNPCLRNVLVSVLDFKTSKNFPFGWTVEYVRNYCCKPKKTWPFGLLFGVYLLMDIPQMVGGNSLKPPAGSRSDLDLLFLMLQMLWGKVVFDPTNRKHQQSTLILENCWVYLLGSRVPWHVRDSRYLCYTLLHNYVHMSPVRGLPRPPQWYGGGLQPRIC